MNKKVFLDVLHIVAEGRFSNMSNKKAKWDVTKDMFNSRTGWPSYLFDRIYDSLFVSSIHQLNLCYLSKGLFTAKKC